MSSTIHSANFFGTPSSRSSPSQMIDYYKVLPSYFLFKQIEQFVNRVDIRNVFDATDLTIMSHTVDCFKRMNYQLSPRMEGKIFQATFICLVSRFFSCQDEETLNEIVLLLFDANADRLIPNHVLTLFRNFVCRRVTSFIAEKKAVKYIEEFTELINGQVIEFDSQRDKSPEDEQFYSDQALYNDLKEAILEHVENHNFHLFAEVLSNADLILENEDESEFLSKLANFKRKSMQHDTLLTEITINSSKLTRRSHAIQNVDDDTLMAAGRHFLEKAGIFAELTNVGHQARSDSVLRTPCTSRRSKAAEQSFHAVDGQAEPEAANNNKGSAKAKSRGMSSQQVLQELEEPFLSMPGDSLATESPVKPDAPKPKSKKKLYTEDHGLLNSSASSADEEEEEDDELDFGHTPGKSKSKNKSPAKVNALLLCNKGKKAAAKKDRAASEIDQMPDLDFDPIDADNGEEEGDGSRPTTSKEAMKKQSKINIQRSTPLKFVERAKKSLVEQMDERRPIPTDSTPASKHKRSPRIQLSESESEAEDEGDDKENRSLNKTAKQADESDSDHDNVASFSKSPSSAKKKKPSTKRSKVRRPWTEKETNYLVAGVLTYGMGSWSRILREYGKQFNERSSVDLRDKYRNLEKQNNLKRFEKQAKILIEKLASKNRAKDGHE